MICVPAPVGCCCAHTPASLQYGLLAALHCGVRYTATLFRWEVLYVQCQQEALCRFLAPVSGWPGCQRLAAGPSVVGSAGVVQQKLNMHDGAAMSSLVVAVNLRCMVRALAQNIANADARFVLGLPHDATDPLLQAVLKKETRPSRHF